MDTYALHGFLGLPSDWDFLPVTPLSLHAKPFPEWAAEFNSRYSGNLIGYSLGGRLALHALNHSPENWESAVIISANPGTASEERLISDEDWAHKFETLAWDTLMKEWNSQPIFNDFLPREEKDYDRRQLSLQLRMWSLAKQAPQHPENLPMPILWVVGELDFKVYIPQLKHPDSKVVVVPNCGHRVPFQQPEYLKNCIKEWKR